jgi:hypothetical protein
MATTPRLAAILAGDVAGHSRLMEADEEGTPEALPAIRRELGDHMMRHIWSWRFAAVFRCRPRLRR